MNYATPTLVVVGAAAVLVQGVPGGHFDNQVTFRSRPEAGIALGLDD